MGLCENMWAWRWHGSAGGFRGVVGVMLLVFSLAHPVLSQTACKEDAAIQNLTQPQYSDTDQNNTNMGFMAALVQSFLYTVQPSSFPTGLMVNITKNPSQVLSDQTLIKELLVSEVGFLVCIAIGILYIVLMPIIGLFLACCRCCGNCGGKLYQKQTSSIHCRRRTLYWCAFATTIIILAGNICMFKSNEDLDMSVDRSPMGLNKSIQNIQTFITAVPEQVTYVVNGSYKTVGQVTNNLQNIGNQLGSMIQRQFNETLQRALYSVKLLDQDIVNTSFQLKKLNSSLDQLQSSADRVQANVASVKSRINQTLSNPNCTGCSMHLQMLQTLTVDTTINTGGLNDFQSAVDEAMRANLQSQVNKAEDYFNSIPVSVTNKTKNVVESSINQLNNIKTQISSQVTNGLSLSALSDVSVTLKSAQTAIDSFLPELKKAEYIRWCVCVTVCCVVLLVVVCNILGLILGPLGLKPKGDPAKRSSTADCGGIFLMMGAGFSFLFSWLFMIAVLVLFLVGGNVYTLVCRPWSNGQLLQLIDTQGLIPELQIGQSLGLKTNISISEIYRSCENNQPLWTTLHLSEIINLGDLLNVSKYTKQIQQDFDNTNINLALVTLMSPESQKQLANISTKAKDFDSTAIMQQLNTISSINLNTTADNLDSLANSQSPDIAQQLRKESDDLRKIQADIDTNIKPQLKNVNSTIWSLQTTAKRISGTAGEVLNNMKTAQDFLNTNSTEIVKTESRRFLDCQLRYVTAYADWANFTITQQVGRCGAVAGALDSAGVILCTHMVESLNAFWFSLGWCIIFFIPSIIFTIKLAKYYRRMKESDSYENHIMMNHIPRAQMKQP
ncbi:prominin-2 [Archocentrus centrarchus]|uniref:prominin-2 n=1 Tax=Archocentrus centrarchus TaxID=63155 RepID=UPI0011E9C17E|nr:prominin-1-A-like [Archocentrus centrarchus]